MTGRVATLAIGLALVLAVGGCAATAQDGGGPAEPQRSTRALTVHSRWESCADASPGDGSADDGRNALALPRLNDGFEPVAAVVCGTSLQKRPSGGSDLVAVEERADDVTALVSALRLPDEEPTDGACTLEAPFVPSVVLLDEQGRWVRPGVPVDACRKPRREVRTAYDQLRTERISTRVLHEVESDEAVAGGCSQQWADMVWVTGKSSGGQDNTAGPLPADDAEIRVCIYRVPPGEQGGAKPAGEFESGAVTRRWPAVKGALAAAGPATACTTPAGRFAVLHLPTGQIYLEADGCRRMLIDVGNGPTALRQGTAELAALLFDS